MATSNSLFSTPLPLSVTPSKPHAPPPCTLSFTTKATPEDSEQPTSDDSFDDRLSNIRLRYRSGQGKKADVRKSKKTNKKPGSSSSGSGANIYLPPVPLKEPMSGGLKVDFGFSPYSERMNGRVAALGLAALVLVELATGESVIKFHSPSIVFVQVYFVAAVTAVYCKVEKEKVSIWPSS
nr:chlorophyll a/b binding protein domain-containing protein [Tanacetum cinerariifolium]